MTRRFVSGWMRALITNPHIHTANDVADYFIALANVSGELMTNLKLQKLVYYAQAWYLANNKEPLISEDFQAWVHGPVVPGLYQEYKKFGPKPIRKDVDLKEVRARIGKEDSEFLDEIASVYMPHGAFYLERMTHVEAPWIDARGNCAPGDKCATVISKESMQKFYAERLVH